MTITVIAKISLEDLVATLTLLTPIKLRSCYGQNGYNGPMAIMAVIVVMAIMAVMAVMAIMAFLIILTCVKGLEL